MTERLCVTLPEAASVEIRAAVDAGEYASASDAVQAAVEHWTDERRLRGLEAETLRRAWDAGKASGRHGALDFETLRRDSRARLSGAGAKPDRAS